MDTTLFSCHGTTFLVSLACDTVNKEDCTGEWYDHDSHCILWIMRNFSSERCPFIVCIYVYSIHGQVLMINYMVLSSGLQIFSMKLCDTYMLGLVIVKFYHYHDSTGPHNSEYYNDSTDVSKIMCT